MLEKEFQYYVDHQSTLVKKYNGRVIVIVGNEVVGDYDDKRQAPLAAKKNMKKELF